MPPVATVGDYGMLVLSGAGGESGMGRGDIHQLEDLILARLLIRDARARSCLERIRTGARCCVKPRLVSGEFSTQKNGGVETHGSWKWDPTPPEEYFLFQEGGISLS